MKKRIWIILAAVALIAAAVVAVIWFTGGSAQNQQSQQITGTTDISHTDDFSVDGTVHIFNISSTGKYILQNGSSDYSVVISRNSGERIVAAAKDFVNFFLEATDFYLPTVYAEDVVYSQDSHFIVIGDNQTVNMAGIQKDAEVLGDQGFHIKTQDNSIFILGNYDVAAQFGTYELLTQLFDFDYFGVDCYQLNRGVTEVQLMNYDITDVPDIGVRMTNYQFLMSDKVTAQRLRLINFGEMVIPVGGANVHNSGKYIPKSQYPDKTDWFSTDEKNLCYTAHGNEEELRQMQRIVADVIIEHFKSDPTKVLITMTHEDTQTLCTCPACTEMMNYYNGSQAASIVIFLNRVCEMVEEYFQTPEGKAYDRDFYVLFFAYHATNKPPVRYDESLQAYVPVDDRVICNPHLIPYFCETNGDYTKDFYDESSVNIPIAENMQGWSVLSEKLYFWMYSSNMSFYLTPYNTFDSTQAIYKLAVENKVDFIYDQGQSRQTGSATGWSWLKIYLYSKLTWNVDQDINELIDKFMENYFGPAAETMKEVFYQWKTFANYQSDVLGYSGSRSIFYAVLDSKLWNRQLLQTWTASITRALEEVEYLKTEDLAKYNMYVKNISTERIAYNYLLLMLFQPNMTEADIALAKEQFYHDQLLANLGLQKELGGSVTDLLKEWGII